MDKPVRLKAATSSRSQVLSEIVRSPGASRRQLADALGVVPATVGSHVKKLAEHGFIRELAPSARGSGRPSIPLQANLECGYLIGVALERDRAAIAAVSVSGEIIGSRSVAYRHGADDTLTIVEGITALRRQLSPATALAMGMTVSGATDQARGEVLISTVLGWSGRNIGAEISAAVGLEVFIENDAIALASRELAFAATVPDSFLLLHLDDGIGMSIVMERSILRGVLRDSTEFGHISIDSGGAVCGCGGVGCVQTVFGWHELNAACPGGLDALAAARGPLPPALAERAFSLGRAVGAPATLLGISSVRVTGRTTRFWPAFHEEFTRGLHETTATLGDDVDVAVVQWTELTMAAGGAGLALSAYLETLR